MDVHAMTALLGGLTPAQFMRRHWQKKPLLVRQAWAGARPPLERSALFALAGRDDVESRLVVRDGDHWRMRRGPFTRRALPPLARADWTLLVQGLDLHDDGARAMLDRFRFVPEARLDDLMVSYATPGGGVGAHLDSYDVFLLQVQGRRRWRVGPVADRSLVDGLPVKILRHFVPTDEWVLEPGDMLYVPPLWGHDGIAEDECMTCSIGFRAPGRAALASELLQRAADEIEPPEVDALYRDRSQAATATPALIPPALSDFAAAALRRALADPAVLARALGVQLTEPKAQVWFDGGAPLPDGGAALVLDRRTRMMYDAQHVFINGEAFRAGGADARLMRQLADRRRLDARALARASDTARALLEDWAEAGWLHAEPASQS
ncbi:cupin domain-containing protein [Aquincola sp. S2]|uniref:Cupin domain-containing protein n=1 Tax=Pseudaquabacterium terrae TaxID=2732868 RepID=A0ABX2EM44_9BURK|nr:cupin domain-containing protein [Aquabacterium terrae]NRF69732.1 cupin domain-containing protein [Aquabacterium terrae]